MKNVVYPVVIAGGSMFLKDTIDKMRAEREREERRKRAGKFILGAALGAAAGAAAGVLFAPKSGRETRAGIASRTNEAMDAVKDNLEETRQMLSDQKERVGDAARRYVEAVKEIPEAAEEKEEESTSDESKGKKKK
jgi:gas vesicle protein